MASDSAVAGGNTIACAPNIENPSNKIQYVAPVQNKTSMAWQARSPFTTLDSYASMADVASGDKLPSNNCSSLEVKIGTSAAVAVIQGFVALFDESGVFIRSVPFTVQSSSRKVSTGPDVYEALPPGGVPDLSQVWVGSASKHHVAITGCNVAGATIYVSTRPYR